VVDAESESDNPSVFQKLIKQMTDSKEK